MEKCKFYTACGNALYPLTCKSCGNEYHNFFRNETQNMIKFNQDMVHNMEELSELQKEISKWVRGDLRKEKLIEEIKDVRIALNNVLDYLKE